MGRAVVPGGVRDHACIPHFWATRAHRCSRYAFYDAAAIADAALDLLTRTRRVRGHVESGDLHSRTFLSAWSVVLFSRPVLFQISNSFCRAARAGSGRCGHSKTQAESAVRVGAG